MNQAPIVTIGLPVYNSQKYIEQSLRSLLAQTYTNFVLIISDNASTDDTAAICKRYAEADPRIQYHRNETNIGNPRNFNRVFELTKTPYLKWSTADDFWEPTFLERAMEIMERDPTIAVCYPRADLVDADGANPQVFDDVLHLVQDDPADRFITLLESIKLAHQHLGVIRMSCLRQTNLLGAHVASDYNLLAELSLYGKFYELPERLFHRRFHKDSGSWKRGDLAHEARRYHATGRQVVPLPHFRRHLAFFASVHRAPLPIASKWRIYRFLLRRVAWDRGGLKSDLLTYFQR
jgi:glycosyltransferase involved in cell wall biosynthesis